MPEVRLTGCRPRPLIGYLKAIGVLKVVAEQTDPSARIRWSDGAAELRSSFDAAALHEFLASDYECLPVLSPWNGGSGFYPKGNSAAVKNLAGIEQSDAPRLRRYRDVIEQTRSILAALGISEKPDGQDKERLVRALRREWPDIALEWLDAAVVMTGEGMRFPPVLGSGGNDGRFDFSSNFMDAAATVAVGPRDRSEALLRAALLDEPTSVERTTFAHFERDASPTHSPRGEDQSLGNPWDLVLAVEGVVLLAAGAARRHDAASAARGNLVAPFTVATTAVGYGSAVGGEAGRAELWLPTWERWATRGELAALIRESRAHVGSGTRVRQATSGLDFARAAAELGVARGIDAFERYAILERAGQSSLAVPVGRIAVSERPAAVAIRTIDGWLGRVRWFANRDSCPSAVGLAARRLDSAVFQLASRGRHVDACALIEELGAMELTLSRSARSATATGVTPLVNAPARPWIDAADDGTHEFAVAAAIASLHDREQLSPALRDYLNGTVDGGRRFDEERRRAISANSVPALLASVHARRHLDAAGSSERSDGDPSFDTGAPCELDSARLLASDRLDWERTLRLLRGLAMLDHRSHWRLDSRQHPPDTAVPTFDLLLVAWRGRHAASPDTSSRGKDDGIEWERLGPRPGWAARLARGSIAAVVRDAVLRLRMAGLPPVLSHVDLLAGPRQGGQVATGQHLAAALLAPVAPAEVRRLSQRLREREDIQETDQTKETA